jgi:serine protease AprX
MMSAQHRPRPGRRRLRRMASLGTSWTAAFAVAAGGAVTGAPAPAAAAVSENRTVILYCDAGTVDAVAAAVVAAGGSVRWRLRATDTVVATVPVGALPRLRSAGGVREITADRSVRLEGATWKPDGDPFSMFKVDTISGAIAAFAKSDPRNRKVTGKDVGVALIDSGVSPVKGVAGAGKVVNGPDLSFESQAPALRHLDTFGHGTHMAGIIAGRDPEVAPDKENDKVHFVGMAPDAHIVNVKVASADGAVDVSQVIAGIDWVVTHRNDPGVNARVLNLSFGTDSTQDERLDPLSHAVESAWRNGIVVVVAAGNGGVSTTRLTMPAVNPYVIAVGAANSNSTDGKADDLVQDFSTGGSATRHPDIVALGRSVASLRVPNSFIDVRYPGALIAGDPDQRYFRGSGTSQAAAVVSGAVALLLQQRPGLTPDQVKKLLTGTATKLDGRKSPLSVNTQAQGAGELDVQKALDAATPTAAAAAQSWPASVGTGLLDAARGTAVVTDPANGVELHGERDIMGQPWNPGVWSRQSASGTAWSGGTWNGRSWTGAGWSSGAWTDAAWSGADWSGTAWSGRSWTDAVWLNGSWSGRSWTGATWTGRSWTDAYWSASIWR